MTLITDIIIFRHKYIYNNYIIILNYSKSWDKIVMILLQGDHYDIKFGKIMDENNRSYIAKFMVSYPEVIDNNYQILPDLKLIDSKEQIFISDLIQKYHSPQND